MATQSIAGIRKTAQQPFAAVRADVFKLSVVLLQFMLDLQCSTQKSRLRHTARHYDQEYK